VAEKEFLGDRRRTQEEEYFQRREQELIAGVHARGRGNAQRQAIAERLGPVDDDLLQESLELGFTPDTVMMVFLVPLLEVAWADGGVTDAEQTIILDAARARGVAPASPAHVELARWLDERPPTEFCNRALKLAAKVLRARPAEQREDETRQLLSYCGSIAGASGGILGHRRVSGQEQRVLDRIRLELEA
jgi:hypothetical protein